MKKILLSIVLLISFNSAQVGAVEIKKGDIVTTIKPIDSFVSGVVGDLGATYLLVDGAQTLHGFILKPSDISAINNAKILFYTDECIENFIKNSVKNINKDTKLVKLSEASGVAILTKREGVNWEKHENQHEHGHEHHDKHECKMDGHMWLSPDNAVAFTKKIAEELAKIYPLHQQTFFNNAEKQILEIQKNAKEITEKLSKLNPKPFIVFHDAFQYYEKYFGATASGSITIDPSIPPSAKRLKEIKDKITKLNVQCVFKEPNFDQKLIDTVTEGREIKSITLDPEGASFSPSKDLYLQIMNNITQGLSEC